MYGTKDGINCAIFARYNSIFWMGNLRCSFSNSFRRIMTQINILVTLTLTEIPEQSSWQYGWMKCTRFIVLPMRFITYMSAFRLHTYVLLLENDVAQTKYLFLARVFGKQYFESMFRIVFGWTFHTRHFQYFFNLFFSP